MNIQNASQQQPQNRYRTKNHEAVMKLKQGNRQIDTMKRRFQYLKVRDQQYRSRTIQHQNKLTMHDMRRNDINQFKASLQKCKKQHSDEVEENRQKNNKIKQQIENNIETKKQQNFEMKEKDYKSLKSQSEKNQSMIKNQKEKNFEEKQENRKEVSRSQEISKMNIQSYNQRKQKELVQNRMRDCSSVLEKSNKLEKQLQKMSLLEEDMIRKSSESMQASQIMKNRLREIFGDERRFTKLPSIHNKTGNSSTRSSSNQTAQLISL